MDKSRVTFEQVLWVLILALALGLRLVNLGAKPLSDAEAEWALQAFSLAPGAAQTEPAASGPQPGTIAITALLFGIFGSSNTLARFVPAIAGVLLCLAPYFVRGRIGRVAALVMGVGLALDPGMIALSRVAGSSMPAVGFGLFGLSLLLSSQAVFGGITLGLALLSGPDVLQGSLILGLTWLLARQVLKPARSLSVDLAEVPGETALPAPTPWRSFLFSILGTIFLVGTLFGFHWQGLGAWAASIPAYLAGWVGGSGIPVLRALLMLIVYQPVAVIFGSISAVRGWLAGRILIQWLALWFVIALAVVLLRPALQPGDLLWALVPLWGLASVFLADSFSIGEGNPLVIILHAGAVFVLMALFWLNLAGFNLAAAGQDGAWMRWAILLGILLLIAMVTALLGFGWSWFSSWRGLAWGAAAALGIYTLAGMWAASQQSLLQPISAWDHAPVTGDADLLVATVQDLSEQSTGGKENIEIALIDVPSMRWIFRSFPNARFISDHQGQSAVENAPIIVLRKSAGDPALAAAYRGQDFGWWRYPAWEGAAPPDWSSWLAYHEEPSWQEDVILWAKADLFPGVELGLEEMAPQPPDPGEELEDIPK